ncbi:uncharacterized protein E5676_scaffold94G00240 [Cucumis melo var. makuwa]|uniref:Mitochondrial protein n=1 Tax=Cucumis melo var. makuwa TaxID=1194695 RepID=A0A5A7V9I3_CUCMM|nr:uncharacterized protein E6C27_scaffold616G00080 [Cucumis melo var. makuwa]TYK15921.1 uncharacterized protein E5676_scaffold94G00240 [Cucumis melo var. makuwa]
MNQLLQGTIGYLLSSDPTSNRNDWTSWFCFAISDPTSTRNDRDLLQSDPTSSRNDWASSFYSIVRSSLFVILHFTEYSNSIERCLIILKDENQSLESGVIVPVKEGVWCPSTNTLHTSSGEISISLWDLWVLGGLLIKGIFYDKAFLAIKTYYDHLKDVQKLVKYLKPPPVKQKKTSRPRSTHNLNGIPIRRPN